MEYVLHVFYGVLMSYIGFISPGMINMAALKISLNKGRKEGLLFAFGAALIVFIQSGIALFFADYFVKNPHIVSYLKIAGVFVFFLLSIVFFMQAKRKINPSEGKNKNRYFFKGIGMATINMLAIPFYLAVSVFLASEGKITIEQPYILLFVFGASLGAFLLFSTYIAFANFIATRISFIAKNINYILSGLFLILGISTLYKLLV